MPVNAKLLEILRCPVSEQPLLGLPTRQLEQLNQRIDADEVLYVDGDPVTEPLDEALITEDRRVIYAIIDQSPAMLPNRGIGTTQLEEFS